MTEVIVVCEGQTEMTFVEEVLARSFKRQQLYLRPTQIDKRGQSGGNVTYKRLLASLRPILLSNRRLFCTTLVDFYGLPAKFPGKQEAIEADSLSDKSSRIYDALREQLATDIDKQPLERFIPYVQMHEFEGLLFSDPNAFARAIDRPQISDRLLEIRRRFATPEHINDNPNTAPSKRVQELYSQYEKPLMGSIAALEITIDTIRQECPLFSAWLSDLERLS